MTLKKVIVLFWAMLILLVGCSSTATSGNENGDSAKEESEQSINIYKDDNISVDFLKVANSAVEGNFEIYIKVQNNFDTDITVYLKDVSLNNNMVQVGSGVPCNIVAGANRTHSYFGRLDLAGADSADDITKISFKIWVVDDEFADLLLTPDLSIDL